MGQYTLPKITWGGSFANTVTIAYPVDNFTSYSKPREGSEWIQSPAGVEDAWIVGRDYYLNVDIRWIPTNNTTNPNATGWDGATGFRAFIEWAQDKNIFRWYPNASTGTYYSCYLVSPTDETSLTYEQDGTRAISLVMRNPTSAIDGY